MKVALNVWSKQIQITQLQRKNEQTMAQMLKQQVNGMN
jgi:hypothetical protein